MTHVDWHPYPDEKPQKDGVYLVTMRVWEATYEDYFEDVGFFYFMNTDFFKDAIHEVIAWAEKPEPYRPEVEHCDECALKAQDSVNILGTKPGD